MIPFVTIRDAIFEEKILAGYRFKIGLLAVVLPETALIQWWPESAGLVPGTAYELDVRPLWAVKNGFGR
jgi:hypothetical protein